MTKKAIRNNISILRSVRDRNVGRVSASIQQKINKVVDLYEDRKISQFSTAERLIKNIATTNEKQRTKGLKEYEKAVEKYEEKEPVSEKQQQALQKAREAKKVKTDDRKVANVRTRLREKTKASAVSRLVRKAREKGFGKTNTYSVGYMFFTTADRDGDPDEDRDEKIKRIQNRKTGFKVNGTQYFPLNPRDGVRNASIKTTPFIESVVNRKITKKFDKNLFKKVFKLLQRDALVKSDLLGYVDAFIIYSATQVDSTEEEFDLGDEPLKDTSNISIWNYYHETLVDPTHETVEEAIKSKHYREDECWINALLEKYEGTELTREKRGKLAKTLSRNKILEILDKTEEEIHREGISTIQMQPVFQFFNIPVKIYNCEARPVYEFIPNKYKHDRHTNIFTGMIKNNHLYPINANWDRLNQMKELKPFELKASTNFYINDTDKPPVYKIFSHIDELLKMTDEDEYHLIHIDNNMTEVLYQLKDAGYEPYVKFQGGKISQIKVSFRYTSLKKTVIYNISSQDLSKEYIERDVVVNTEDKYNRLINAMFAFNKAIFSENHKSKYDDIDISILNECRTIVPMGYLHKHDKLKELVEIDRTKAFTWAFKQIKRIPKFNEFDIWKPIIDEIDIYKLSSLTLYMVEVYEGNMFFNKKINLIYGKFLRKMVENGVKLKIICYKQPCYLHKVDYSKVVNDLWDTYISDDIEEDKSLKKKVANINFGMLEKSNNTSQRTKVFNSLKEACYYQGQYGGKIIAIQRETVTMESYDDDDFSETTAMGDTYYILNTTDKQQLVNGFIYIKELLLQYHNYAMYDAYTKLRNNDVKVYSVKSDAFTIHEDDLNKVKGIPNCVMPSLREGILKFDDAIGNWRVSKSRINFPNEKYKYKFNRLIEIPSFENVKLEVADEFDTETICNQIIQSNPCMIRAKYAGSGKSYIAKYFNNLGYRVLSVVPHNRLSQEIDGDAVTLNMFFRIPVHKGDELPQFDHSDFDIIFFDEIFMSNEYIYGKILRFVRDNPKKIIIGAGDTKQLPPINDLTNTQQHDQYADQCIDKIFKHNIYLKVCKRIGEKDRITLDNLYNDFWIHQLPIADIIEKYFRYTNKIDPSHMNIAYTNNRCKMVSDEVRKKLGKTAQYELNEELICRLYYKNNGMKFNVNIRYRIININFRGITIENIKDKKDRHTVPEDVINKHFRYGYCATCHSCQGASIKNNITIHEWNKSYLVSREWLWTSLTRATDYNNVYFFNNDSIDDKMQYNQIINYFKNKIDGYKQQDARRLASIRDMKQSRSITGDNYIDVKWCMDRMRGTCGKCGCDFHIENKKGCLTSNFTCQRVDNNFSHTKDNSVAYCIYCNCSSK